MKAKGADYLKMLQSPRHGYGSNMNPCIDCRIFMLKKTAEFIAEVDASFVVTGEVLGQRPMSHDIREFSCPAGGCLLTAPVFAGKLRDLFHFNPDCTMADAALLKIGRHFRLPDATKLILGRNKEENERLRALGRAGHLFLEPLSFTGPSALVVRGGVDSVPLAANLMAAYAKSCDFPLTVRTAEDKGFTHTVDRVDVDIDRWKV